MLTKNSIWNDFPTVKSPYEKYKFSSFSINFNKDLQKIERSTYSFLDWLGDCGGLAGAL